MRVIFKEKDIITVASFIFDIFSKYSTEGNILNKEIREVVQVFRKDQRSLNEE